MNRFYNLPNQLKQQIYLYDPTHRSDYMKVMHQIKYWKVICMVSCHWHASKLPEDQIISVRRWLKWRQKGLF